MRLVYPIKPPKLALLISRKIARRTAMHGKRCLDDTARLLHSTN
jgi:hypothetical protein